MLYCIVGFVYKNYRVFVDMLIYKIYKLFFICFVGLVGLCRLVMEKLY